MEFRSYSFERLEAWKKARELTKMIYQVTAKYPNEERFGLISQIRRASVSVASNLAEGSGRITNKDKAHYSAQAYSSLMEVLNQLIISFDLGYIDKPKYQEVRSMIDQAAALISGLRKSQTNK